MGTGHEVLILAGTQQVNIALVVHVPIECNSHHDTGLHMQPQVHHATIEHLQLIYPCVSTPLLNELRGGDLDGINRDTIKEKFPEVR